MLSNSGRDEFGRYIGGAAGDQSKDEWSIVNWYNYPFGGWNFVLHHPDENIRALIAKLATEAAHNDNIGYDQSQRYTFWNQLASSGYRPANINTPCESDCSAGVLAICKAVGYLTGDERLKAISIYGYTGTEVQILTAAGFECLNGTKYLNGEDYLHAGDVLLNEDYHTCICITDGKSVPQDVEPYYVLQSRQLGLGSKGKDVYVMQCALKMKTFYAGSIDAHFGDGTFSAVISLQQKVRGLNVDGLAGPSTLSILYGLQYLGYEDGVHSWAIKECKVGTDHTDSTLLMQVMLKVKKFYKGELDGNYGTKTKNAVKNFQKTYQKLGLKITGECDVKTIEKIMTPTSQLKKELEAA